MSLRTIAIFLLTLLIFTINDTLSIAQHLEATRNEIQNINNDENFNYIQDDKRDDMAQIDYLVRQKRFLLQGKHNGQKDTNSGSPREAFRNAKDQNGIPRSQQPTRQYSVPDKNNPNQNLRQYDFKDRNGNPVSIRRDNPRTYPDGGQQGPHYNAGPSGEKLKQHHNFPSRRRG